MTTTTVDKVVKNYLKYIYVNNVCSVYTIKHKSEQIQKFIRKIWWNSCITITKCWRHVGFYIDDANENHDNMVCDDENVISLQEIIDKLDIKAKLTAHDYIQTEDDYPPVNVLEMTEEDIIDLIKETG